jgi:protein O-GlcNAc transferase
MEKKLDNIQKLFLEKRYSELIYFIEFKIDEKQKNSGILNLLGACKILKGKPSKESLSSAIEDFRQGYLKEKETKYALEALRNFINASVDLYDFENSSANHKISINNFDDAILYFKETQSLFENDELLILALTRIFKRLGDTDQTIFYLGKLIENKHYRLLTICSYIYQNSFNNNWSQKEFLKYGKFLAEKLPKYPEDRMVKINNSKNNKIRIAFLSSDLRASHSVTFFLKTILKNYNKKEYEIYLYLNNKEQTYDNDTKSFIALADETVNISILSDIQAINLIRKDHINIMFDLMGVTSKNRITLFKNRLAPIQVSWCGYCNTTGLNEMDYIIADPHLIYDEEKNLYSEKIIYLPDIWNCHSGLNIKREEYPPPIINNKYITFGSFNNFLKINDNVVEVWSKILQNIKNSKLILKPSSPRDISKLTEKFKKKDVLKSIVFEERKKNAEDHLNLYKKIDIALDTFPYTGVTTSFEAIWMGVPVLTMRGHNFQSRCGESINKNINLDYLIAKNEKDYFKKAEELSINNEKLLDIRKIIFKNAQSSPLFDDLKFSKEFFKSLEKLYNKL